MNKKIKDRYNNLKKLEEKYRLGRAERNAELSVEINQIKKAFPYKANPYLEEAGNTYIYGNYRSTIFCCIAIVELVIKKELIETHGKRRQEIERNSLGILIGKINSRMGELYKQKANITYLKNLRNKLIVHPLHIRAIKNECEGYARTNKDLQREIKNILYFLSDEQKNNFLSRAIAPYKEVPKTFIEELSNPSDNNNLAVLWNSSERSVMKMLAKNAFDKMKIIIESLYPNK